MFITFEGIDFSGKSTQATLIARWLEEQQIPHLLIREPGGTEISESIRSLLLDVRRREMHALTELFLFSAARSQLAHEKIRPAIEAGMVVLADRFFDSTTAYQGYGRGIDIDFLTELHRVAAFNLNPDHTFFIDIDIDESKRRRQALRADGDRMEQADDQFFRRVRGGYLSLAARYPGRFIVLDGLQPVESITAQIRETISGSIMVSKHRKDY